MQIPKTSPWGKVQSITNFIDGMVFVSTASHGGIKLSRQLNAKIPAYMRRAGGWYEEDIDWCIPFIIFNDELLAQGKSEYAQAVKTMLSWLPETYEKYFNTTVTPEQSYIRASEVFHKENAEKHVVFSAVNSNRFPGMVEAIAGIGKEHGKSEIRLLIPKEEYENRNHFGFVVENPEAYQTF